MSCGARLPVYVLFAAAFFPHNGQNLVFGLYIIGILAAIGTGMLMKKTLLPGISTGFMMELPPYHIPKLKGILLRTWDRLKGFIKDAGKVIIVMVMVINTLSAINMQGRFAHGDTEHSVLGVVSQTATPLFAPMGIHQDNWPAVLGIFTGIMAKEVVVSTLAQVYHVPQEQPAGAEDTGFWAQGKDSITGLFQAALDTIKTLPAIIGINLFPPQTESEPPSLVSAIRLGFEQSSGGYGALAAFAFMVYVLIYSPCVATMAAQRQELGARWMWISITLQLTLGWILAFIVFQGGKLLLS